jgi:hypothetical protein
VVETLKRCASLPFTEAFGNGMAGEPFTMRFVDDRPEPEVGAHRAENAILNPDPPTATD